MKWTHLTMLLAVALAASATAAERRGPARPSLPNGQLNPPIIETYPSYRPYEVNTNAYAQDPAPALADPITPDQGPAHEHAAAAAPVQAMGPCLNCGNQLHACCRHEMSCCDNVWDDYCAEKRDWCTRERRCRGLFRSLFSCFPEDCNGCSHCTLLPQGRCGQGCNCNACDSCHACNDGCGCSSGKSGLLSGRRRAMKQTDCSCAAAAPACQDAGCGAGHVQPAPAPPGSPVTDGAPTPSEPNEFQSAPAAPEIDPEPPTAAPEDPAPTPAEESSSARRPFYRSSMQLEQKPNSSVLRWKQR